MKRSSASRLALATSLIIGLGVGCGSTGGGCSLKPLPKDPAPFGLPSSQVVEGGIQARITKPGMAKLTSSISNLFGSSLGNGFCASQPNQLYNFLGQTASVCAQPSPTCTGGMGCSAYVYLNSKDRPASHVTGDVMPPAPAGDNEGGNPKDKIVITVVDSPPAAHPQIVVDAFLDILVPVSLSATGIISGSCYMYAYTNHVDNDSADPMHIQATIGVTIDPTTGELALNLDDFQIPNIGLTTDGQGGVCGTLSSITSSILSFLDNLPSVITNFIIGLLKPTLNNLIQSFLPKPLGLAGVMNAGSLLASFSPPPDANLEMFVVPGGYVQSSQGGLTLGVMSGMNSDRDESTRTPDKVSEPSLCVPSRPVPDLSMAPWMLPAQPMRNDFTLMPAGPFSGNPDPTDMNGNLEDVALGISRTFLDLAGFHIYNSGTLCLTVGGSTIPQLTGGTLAVLINSLGNILEDKKAPLELVLRPQTPLTFTLGAGDMNDPLIHVAVSDLRIDFYTWIEERYVRLLTLGLDLNLGVNLTVTKDATTGQPAIQPMLLGLDAKNIVIRVSNTDLLQETPAALEALFPSLINIATGALGGVLKPFPLPAIAGFTLDNLSISRVQTQQDDFLGIFASIAQGTPAPLIDWTDPQHPRPVGELVTKASVAQVVVPAKEQLQALFADGASPLLFNAQARPHVVLDLAADHAENRPVEYAWRIDGGWWHPWTEDSHPVIADDAFLLQGFHTVEVRSRVVNQWSTEDSQPPKLTVLIDSVPPELHPAKDLNDSSRLAFNGFDIVSDTKKLTYSYLGFDGKQTPFSPVDGMPIQLAKQLTQDGARPLFLYAKDEAGNVGEIAFDVGKGFGLDGRTTTPPSAGCGSCALGGTAPTGGRTATMLVTMALLGLLARRRWRALLALVAVAAVGFGVAGCGCDNGNVQCKIDDDCAKMMCNTNQVAVCQQSMCQCAPDIGFGDVGRFSSMTMIGSDAYVAAYNTTYGDLMVGHVTPPGVVANWDFVDGVPDEGPTNSNNLTNSHVRGGIDDKGDDVGRYTSIDVTPAGDPIIAYYDVTHSTLKFASFGAARWHTHVVDKGVGSVEGGGDDVGRWASMSLGPDGRPAIAYTATAMSGTKSGMPEGQLRFAQAKVPDPQSTDDWMVTVLDARPLPQAMTADGGAPDGGTGGSMTEPLLPEGIGLMPSLARKSDGSPGIAYYDRTNGNLRYIEFLTQMGSWGAPIVLDGEDAMGHDTGNVGMYPSLVYDEKDVGNISYVDDAHNNLLFVDTMAKTPEVVDDGYRPGDETTQDGLPSPVYHQVGDSSSVKTATGQIVIAYQDATAVELRVAQKGQNGKWQLATLAGHAMNPFMGSYGFYANLRISGPKGIISSYAINQQMDDPSYYVEVFSIDLGLIM